MKKLNLFNFTSMKGFNLNQSVRAVLVMLLFPLSVGNAWGHDTDHYGQAKLINATGNGTVYLSTSASDKNGQTGASNASLKDGYSYINWNCNKTESADKKDVYAIGTPNEGYYWQGWAESAGATTYKSTSTKKTCTATGTSSSSRNITYLYGYFAEVTISAGEASPSSIIDAENNLASCEDYTGTITFTTKADAKNDFKEATPPFTKTGHGTFSVTDWSVAPNGIVTVSYKFTGNNTYGGGVTPELRSRTTTGLLTLTSKPGNNSNTCTVTASFPNIVVAAGSADAVSTTNTVAKPGTATFPVQWADDEKDFTAAFSDISGGGAWTPNSISYTATDAQSGTITVNYTFNPQTVEGSHSAKLTLSANANAGGASNYVVINAESEALASYDASVTYNNNTTNYGKLADAIADANSQPGAVVKLLRNIPVDDAHKISSPISVTGMMTLDLNSYTIEKTGLVDGNARVFDINMSNANSVFAIMDSRTGGKIRGVGDNNNNLLTTVYVTNGILSFASGEIECVNTNIGANAKATGIRTLADAKLLMTGGTITATSSGSLARGVYPKTAPGTENYVVISGGTINVTGATQATGIDCESSSTTVEDPTKASVILSGVTVNVETTSTTEAIAIRTAPGVSLGIQSGTYNATAKTQNTYAIHSSGYTAVLGGTFNATSTTRTAFGVFVNGGITAVKGGTITATAATHEVHASKVLANAKLLTYGGTFRGICTNVASDGWATGAQVMSTGTLEAQGGTFVGEVNKTGLSSEQTATACGVYANTGSNVTMSNATLRGQVNSDKLKGNTAANYFGAHGILSVTANKVMLTNCTIQGQSAYDYSFGIRTNASPIEIKNCTVSGTGRYATYGIYAYGGKAVDAFNSSFSAVSQSTLSRGALVYAALTADACTFNSQALQSTATAAGDANIRGVWIPSGYSATLNNCTVTASGGTTNTYANNVHGLFVDGTVDVEGGTVTASHANSTAYAIFANAAAAKIGVGSGKFKATATSTYGSINGTANVDATRKLYGGYYNTYTNLEKYLPAGYGIETLPSGSTEYGEGYRYAIRPTTDLGVTVCKIGATPYTTLEEALEYANKNSGTTMTILMVANYTLPAGNYTLPAKATLLVPYKADQTTAIGTGGDSYVTDYTNPSLYRKLMFASGVKMAVLGTIEVSGSKYLTSSNATGIPTGPYGQLVLEGNAHIDLENQSKLVAWGYVTGSGDVNAKSGASVYEVFQLLDMKGGGVTSQLINDDTNPSIFPVTHYAYQNVESEITYRPGSKAIGWTGASVQKVNQTANDVMMVGNMSSGALFLMNDEGESSDTWVKKKYDSLTDRVEYTLNNTATLGSINVDLGSVKLASSKYILPIASNMTITMKYGTMTLNQNTYFMPGAVLNIEKEAKLTIPSGKELYFVDKNQWVKGYAPAQYICYVPYSPSFNNGNGGAGKTYSARKDMATNNSALQPAELFVHGEVEVNGALYTTESGANIHSTNADAGTITFNSIAANKNFCQLNSTCGEGRGGPGGAPGGGLCDGILGSIEKATCTSTVCDCYYWNWNTWPCTSAQLKNETGFTSSASNGAGTYVYKNNAWTKVAQEGCFTTETDGSGKHYYANPSDIVEVTRNADDSYRDVASGLRRFVWDNKCEWWEVETTPTSEGYYKAIKADHNGKYNYYEYNSTGDYWQVKNVTITWNINGTTTNYSLGYGTHPKYLSANPTKASTSTEYYTWTGWTKGSTNGEFFAKDAELPEVTENTTFYAYFEAHKFEYTITFKNYDGTMLEAKRWAHGETPIYEGTPTKPSTVSKVYNFTGWTPAVAPATASATYTAQFDAGVDRTYTVQWVNYDGKVLKEEQVAYNTTPSEPAVAPTRPNDTYYTYTFEAWSPAVAAVTGNQTYSATYTYEKKVNKYEVLFKNGTTTIYTQNLEENLTPVFGGTTPAKTADAQYTYTFDGWSTTDGGALAYAAGAALPALTGDVTYYAHFATATNNYRIIWKSENGKVTLETDPTVPYGVTPEYNGSEPTKARVGKTGYEFDGWSASIGGEKLTTPLPNVTEDKVFYAHFLEGTYYNITFNAKEHGTAPAGYEAMGGSKLSAPEEPTETGYTFGGWYKESACTNVWDFATETVTGNVTLYAKWTPNTNTKYTVKHYQQNIADDDYTEVTADQETKQGITATATAATAKSYTGFAAQPISQETIAGDGTTVVNIYYNRMTYTITWADGNGTTIETDANVKYGATPVYNGSTPTKNQTVEHTYTFNDTWSPAIGAVTGNVTYTAQFSESPRSYTVTWLNGDGNPVEIDENIPYGTMPEYNGETPPTKTTDEYSYVFNDTWSPAIVTVAGDATYTAQFDKTKEYQELDVVDSQEPVTIDENTNAVTTVVAVSGTLKVTENTTLTTTDLILEATADGSGNISGIENVEVSGNVYFDYQFNTDPWHWSAFGVPFEINLDEFAPLKEKITPMALGTDYDIVYYNTANRAANGLGKKSWEYVENHEHILVPGRLYMIAFNHPVGHVDVVRFTKASNAVINYTTPVAVTSTGNGTDDNWNGIANPKMYHALLSAGVEECQVHDGGPIGSDGYHSYTMHEGETDYKFFVGKAAFVQVPEEQSVVEISPADDESPIALKNNAPRRSQALTSAAKYTVQIISEEGEIADRVFIRAEEGKDDKYVIVSDLSKMGVSPLRAQFWVNRYGLKLCKNTAALVGSRADYPLGISIPVAGEYEINLDKSLLSNDNIYLTYDGRVIWNLSSSPFMVNLDKGTNTHYGLRLVINSPQVTTGMDEALVDAQGETRKVLINDHVFIIRGENVYGVDGQLVK